MRKPNKITIGTGFFMIVENEKCSFVATKILSPKKVKIQKVFDPDDKRIISLRKDKVWKQIKSDYPIFKKYEKKFFI